MRIPASHETANTTRGLVATMRIDRNCGLDETRQQTRVSLRVKSTERSARASCLFRKWKRVTCDDAETRHGPRPWCPERASYAALQRARARPACNRHKPKSHGHVKKAAAPVHNARESNFEVAVYLKMTRKKNTEKSRTSRHAYGQVSACTIHACLACAGACGL